MGEDVPKQNTVSKALLGTGFLKLDHGSLSVNAAGAWLVTMVTPSLGQEITAALALARMVLVVDASLPGAVTKILLRYSLPVFVSLGTLVSHVPTW